MYSIYVNEVLLKSPPEYRSIKEAGEGIGAIVGRLGV